MKAYRGLSQRHSVQDVMEDGKRVGDRRCIGHDVASGVAHGPLARQRRPKAREWLQFALTGAGRLPDKQAGENDPGQKQIRATTGYAGNPKRVRHGAKVHSMRE
ncbi:MAG: hypothetical protein CME43_03980 [Haliea sp.]|nr:hypothetical protein [Haliea sp.]